MFYIEQREGTEKGQLARDSRGTWIPAAHEIALIGLFHRCN
jgi:hypothetical protein